MNTQYYFLRKTGKYAYVYLSLILCSLFCFSSCSLDYDPVDTYSDVTEGIASDSSEVVNRATVENQRQVILNKFRDGQEHWYLDMLLLAESHSDNAYAGSPNAETTPFEVNSIEGSNTNLNRDWNGHMSNVAEANLLIEYLDLVNDPALTAQEREQIRAEAKIFRAMVYFDMVRIWGNVPLVTAVGGDITSETIEEVYPAYFPPQTDEKIVYEQIERDLLEALPNAPANNSTDKTLLTQSVARALLAKIYAEKPLRNYDNVIKYCDELTADGYDLVADFSDLFGVVLADPSQPAGQDNRAVNSEARNTKETIFEAQFTAGSSSWVTWMYGRDLADWNLQFSWAKWITPSRDLIKAFQSESGDKRLNESIVYYSCGWNIYYPADSYAFMYKCRSAYNSIIKFRYADILLLKAEALIMKNDLAGAATIINRIRNRAGLGNLPSSATASQQALLNAYLKERRLELAFEGQRWFDLVRLDKVEEVLNQLRDEGRPALVYLYDANSYKLPIPQAVMDQNPNLVQNPGY
ncbi:MAG: RagB/SusD family nutrient uptake outer membrane protein [Tannerella sp.]|jgi:hypothetical protein|nr:RagB/SusD family nutrient uptake outer membrane protein [Tannerella sp.]